MMIIYMLNNEEFETLEDLRDAIEYELDGDSTLYDEMLDELGDVEIGSYSYPHSLALERVDPIAYGVGMNDYYDSVISDIMYDLEMATDGEIVYTSIGDIEVFEVEDGDL